MSSASVPGPVDVRERLIEDALPVEALDTPAEVFAQILYERRYELYMQGLRWEDIQAANDLTDSAVGAAKDALALASDEAQSALEDTIAGAERIKTLHGSAIASANEDREMIEAPPRGDDPGAGPVGRADL